MYRDKVYISSEFYVFYMVKLVMANSVKRTKTLCNQFCVIL